MASDTSKEELFTAEVETFMITEDNSTAKQESTRKKCSHVLIVQPCENLSEDDGYGMHKIIMYDHAKEVSSAV